MATSSYDHHTNRLPHTTTSSSNQHHVALAQSGKCYRLSKTWMTVPMQGLSFGSMARHCEMSSFSDISHSMGNEYKSEMFRVGLALYLLAMPSFSHRKALYSLMCGQ